MKYTVYLPCIYSEVYEDIEASSPEEAIKLVEKNLVACVGETKTGKEHLGTRAVKQKE